MKTVILGHDGFIGQHILACYRDRLVAAEFGGLVLPNLDLRVSDQAMQLAPLFTSDSTILMCAGIKRQWGDTLEIFHQNMAIVENVCAVLARHSVKKFIFLSSAAVYGENVHNTNISEDTTIRLGTYYAISKYASEGLLSKTLAAHPGTSLVILRPPLVYGKGDTSKGYGPAGFLESILNDREITLWGDGSELRELLYVLDLAKLICDLMESDFSGVINPVSGVSASFQDIIGFLAKITGKTPQVTSRARSKEKVDSVFCGSLVRNVLPEFKFTSLQDGLRKMAESEIDSGKSKD